MVQTQHSVFVPRLPLSLARGRTELTIRRLQSINNSTKREDWTQTKKLFAAMFAIKSKFVRISEYVYRTGEGAQTMRVTFDILGTSHTASFYVTEFKLKSRQTPPLIGHGSLTALLGIAVVADQNLLAGCPEE